jgi:putative tryptophan/tyrosine transport system substrate-binding protein
MMRRLSTRLAVRLGLTLIVLWAAQPALAQTPRKVPHIGYLWLGAEGSDRATTLPGFKQGLRELGYTEGGDIVIEYRYAAGSRERLRELIADTVASNADVIVAPGVIVADAVKQATATIPVVAVTADPVGSGLVASLARPGGNITGFANIEFTMVGQGLELLKEMAPSVRRVALIFNPLTAPYYPLFLRELEASPARLPAELAAAPVHDEGEVEAAIATLAREPAGGLIAAGDPFINAHRALIMRLAQHHRLPAIYAFRQFVAEGGLMSYGPDSVDIARRSASYVDRILKGTTPAELPVQQPTRFKLAINLKTAKALGLTAPDKLLAIADEVIE